MTDAIVDFAVHAGKPFAVVPCCVFPRCGHGCDAGIHAYPAAFVDFL